VIQRHINYKRYKKAEQRIAQLLKLNPEHKHALGAKINLFIQTKRLKKAQETIEQALGSYPENNDFKLKKGLVLSQQEKHDEALAIFYKVVNHDPFNKKYKQALVQQLNFIGLQAIDKTHFSKAKTYFQKAVSLAPHDSLALHKPVNLLIQQKQYTEAKSLIDHGLKNQKQ